MADLIAQPLKPAQGGYFDVGFVDRFCHRGANLLDKGHYQMSFSIADGLHTNEYDYNYQLVTDALDSLIALPTNKPQAQKGMYFA